MGQPSLLELLHEVGESHFHELFLVSGGPVIHHGLFKAAQDFCYFSFVCYSVLCVYEVVSTVTFEFLHDFWGDLPFSHHGSAG